jgi:hypothetical protein
MTSHCYGEAMGFAGALPILPVTRRAKACAVVAARASLDATSEQISDWQRPRCRRARILPEGTSGKSQVYA